MLFCAAGQCHLKIRRLQNTVTKAISNGYFKNMLWLPGGLFPPTLGVWMWSGHIRRDWKGPKVQVNVVGYISKTSILSLDPSKHTKRSFCSRNNF